MSNRVYYHVWGAGAHRLGLGSGFALLRPQDSDRVSAVVRSLERRTGLVCCGGPRSEGTALRRGRPYEQHYALTLGEPVARKYGGGFTPRAEVWFAIACRDETEG